MAAEEKPATVAETPLAGTEVPADVVSPQRQMLDTLFITALLFAIFYFILIRPQQRRMRAHQEMVRGLAKGSKVVTGGGIIGTVVKLEGDDVAVVEISPNVKVRVTRASIGEVLPASKTPADTANDN